MTLKPFTFHRHKPALTQRGYRGKLSLIDEWIDHWIEVAQ